MRIALNGRKKGLEYKVGEDACILYHEADIRDKDAAQASMFAGANKGGEFARMASFKEELLASCVDGWSGFVDVDGNDIPYARGIVNEVLDAAGCREDVYARILGMHSEEPASPLATGTGSKPTSKRSTKKK